MLCTCTTLPYKQFPLIVSKHSHPTIYFTHNMYITIFSKA
jgi:hypothetical protein